MMPTTRRRAYVETLVTVATIAAAALVACTAAVGQQQNADSTTDPHKRMQSVSAEFTAIGSELCSACHPDRVEKSGAVRHLRILTREEEEGRFGGCEACHGRGSGHMEQADPVLIYGSDDKDKSWVAEGCFVCHTNLSKQQWLDTSHWHADVTCNSCHSMHDPESGDRLLKYDPLKDEQEYDLCLSCHETMKAQFGAYSHHPVTEDRVKCSDCHDLHAPGPTTSGDEPVIKECVNCHREKEPPFAFEHEPVTGDLADGCLTCHNPHGSPNPSLLKLPGQAVCLQCHSEQAVGHHVGATCWQVRCHQQVHGSNVSPVFLD